MVQFNNASSGLKGLDDVIHGLRKGDNVVWQVDDIRDYKHFVIPFVIEAIKSKKKIIYMRFAEHEPLLEPQSNLKIYKLDAYNGFESFSSQIHKIIKNEGKDVYYVFDCLSYLLSAWATDIMIGNFFIITCPYLFELNTVAYFSILRNNHSFKTIARIRETTQVLFDLYNLNGDYYIHPLKVWNRYSPTMFLPHFYNSNLFKPVTNSLDSSKILSYIYKKGSENTKRNLDYWDRLFLEAEELVKLSSSKVAKKRMANHLSRIMIGREDKMLDLVKDFISLEDLLQIKTRLIGTGYIGGKTVGMLLARKILSSDKRFNWEDISEQHDSFYIGSDVFYTYIVQNGWWKLWMEHKTEEGYFSAAVILKEKMLNGLFPDEIKEQLQVMIEYYGQSPIIIRSSSLLEDSFGNAFAGKYESIFNANQGTFEQRYSNFENAVRYIFSSTMNESALTYRLQRGLSREDEQMAILVQRVSGSYHKNYFFPDLAGVGISHNIFSWKENMNPEAGMLRLVFGLGTRAVNRVENDYPRIVALDSPLTRPVSGIEDIRKYSQHYIDLLNLNENNLQTIPLIKIVNENLDFNFDLIGIRDNETAARMHELKMKEKESWIITFDEILSKTAFADIIQKILKILEASYKYPVEIEFTGNFSKDKVIKINLLQCRPIQMKQKGKKVEMPAQIRKEKILFESKGFFMGGNISQIIKLIIYVDPKNYIKLSLSEKYDIARIIGKINKKNQYKEKTSVMIIGPGRWGTTTPSLGIPVNFAEINNFTVMTEISYKSGDMTPELSFGTHFFQDLVETNIFYVALFTEKENVYFNEKWFKPLKNSLVKIVPENEKYQDVLKVYDVSDKHVKIMADILSQKVICGNIY